MTCHGIAHHKAKVAMLYKRDMLKPQFMSRLGVYYDKNIKVGVNILTNGIIKIEYQK